MKTSSPSIAGRVTLGALFIAIGLVLLLFTFTARVRSANPPSGGITPAGAPLAWDGTATGTGSARGEDTCVEDVTCDTFTVTVGGTQADWTPADKRVQVTIAPGLAAND